MSQIVTDENGQQHEFPDEATPEMISSALNVKYSGQPSRQKNSFFDLIKNKLGELGNFPEVPRLGEENSFTGPAAINDTIAGFSGGPGMNIIGAPKGILGRMFGTVMSKIVPRDLAILVQKGHDLADAQASKIYDSIKNAVKSRGIKKIDVPKNVLDEAELHLPKTRANKKLVDESRSGDYEALHKLQSDLRRKANKALSSDSYAESNLGEEMEDTRDKINDAISQTFKNTGNHDLDISLKNVRQLYKNIKDTYFSHNTIAKLVHPDIRKIPENPINVFSEESVPMNRVINAHPEIKEMLKVLQARQKILYPLLKNSLQGLGAGAALGGMHYGKELSDYLRND